MTILLYVLCGVLTVLYGLRNWDLVPKHEDDMPLVSAVVLLFAVWWVAIAFKLIVNGGEALAHAINRFAAWYVPKKDEDVE